MHCLYFFLIDYKSNLAVLVFSARFEVWSLRQGHFCQYFIKHLSMFRGNVAFKALLELQISLRKAG